MLQKGAELRPCPCRGPRPTRGDRGVAAAQLGGAGGHCRRGTPVNSLSCDDQDGREEETLEQHEVICVQQI